MLGLGGCGGTRGRSSEFVSVEVWIRWCIFSQYLGSESRFITVICAADVKRGRRRRYTKTGPVVDDRSVEGEALDVEEGIRCNIGVGHGDFVDPVDDRAWCWLGLEVECGDYTDAMSVSERDGQAQDTGEPVGSSSEGL